MKSVSFALDAAYSTISTGPTHIEVALEHVARVREHVVARLEHALVARARQDRGLGPLRHRQHRVDAADRRHRIRRVVRVAVGRLVAPRLVAVELPARVAGTTA